MILTKFLNYKIFPSLNEILIYENKRFLSYWLKANNIPHPKTTVFYSDREALGFLDSARFPLMAKLNIGSSGKGVKIIKNRREASDYIRQIFARGVKSRIGPNLSKGDLINRLKAKINNPDQLKERLKTYKTLAMNYQKGFVIFQEYIPHKYEWRVVRIGDSFFAHKKVVKDEKASGSLFKEYLQPPLSLLDFVRDLTDKFQFYSQAVDIFEISEGQYLVNENNK